MEATPIMELIPSTIAMVNSNQKTTLAEHVGTSGISRVRMYNTVAIIADTKEQAVLYSVNNLKRLIVSSGVFFKNTCQHWRTQFVALLTTSWHLLLVSTHRLRPRLAPGMGQSLMT